MERPLSDGLQIIFVFTAKFALFGRVIQRLVFL